MVNQTTWNWQSTLQSYNERFILNSLWWCEGAKFTQNVSLTKYLKTYLCILYLCAWAVPDAKSRRWTWPLVKSIALLFTALGHLPLFTSIFYISFSSLNWISHLVIESNVNLFPKAKTSCFRLLLTFYSIYLFWYTLCNVRQGPMCQCLVIFYQIDWFSVTDNGLVYLSFNAFAKGRYHLFLLGVSICNCI